MMLSARFGRAGARAAKPHQALEVTSVSRAGIPACMGQKRFKAPVSVGMHHDLYNPPSSTHTWHFNKFIRKPLAEHVADMEQRIQVSETSVHKVTHHTDELIPTWNADPHQRIGITLFGYVHYKHNQEPVFPFPPNVAAGELAAGANLVRTTAWKEDNVPALLSIAAFDPHNQRPRDYVANVPVPESSVPEGVMDFRHARLSPGHADRRPWIYMCMATSNFVAFSILRAYIFKIVHLLWPSRETWAAGVIEVNVDPIEEGANFAVKWNGKAVFIRHLTADMIEKSRKDDAVLGSMRDPETHKQRCRRPEWLVVIGICTHLGCIPYPDQGDWGGYFCPCHGSHYDHSGRIRKGPAPLNLEIPPHSFINDSTLKIG